MKRKVILLSLIAIMALLVTSTVAVTVKPGSAAPAQTASLVGGTMGGTGPSLLTWYQSQNTYVYAVDTRGTLWYKMIMNDSSTWQSLGGVCTASPATAKRTDFNTERNDVFVRGSDGALWWKSYQNGWSGWKSLGGQLASGTGPAVSSWSKDRLDVFVQGTDNVLWHKWWQGSQWSGWEALGGALASSPAAASVFNTTTIDVFVRGTDSALWYKNWTGHAWSGWKSLGGRLAPSTGPAVNYFSYRLFVQGTDHQLWRKDNSGSVGWTAGGATWVTLAGKPPEALSTSSPASSNIPANDHTIVGVATTSGNVWYSVASLSSWDQWTSVGSPTPTPMPTPTPAVPTPMPTAVPTPTPTETP